MFTIVINPFKLITTFLEISNWFWITLCHTFQLFGCSVYIYIYIYISKYKTYIYIKYIYNIYLCIYYIYILFLMPYSIFIIKVTLYIIFLNIYHFFIVYVIFIEKKLQNYSLKRITAFDSLLWSTKKWKNNNKIDK